MSWLILLRFVKYLGVSALVGGAMAAALCQVHEERRRIGLRLVLPAFGVTWTAGFLLAHQVSISLLSLWILGAMASSMAFVFAMLFAISKPHRSNWASKSLIFLLLSVALFFMIARPELGCSPVQRA
ncbi:MAG: hypothetical protein MUF64_18440 [Polyangiaceae bacterium]|nr:hypothetical protein [Polyangiaceae bacterium]